MKEKTIQDPSYTGAERMPRPWRDPVKMSPSHTHTPTHSTFCARTHKNTSQLRSDETPTARHSVVTHAIIAFPPAARNNTVRSGVRHFSAASRSHCRMERVRPTMTNRTAELDPPLTPQRALTLL